MTLFEKFKKTWLLIVLCLLLTACGADAPAVPANPPEEPSVETPTETPGGCPGAWRQAGPPGLTPSRRK